MELFHSKRMNKQQQTSKENDYPWIV